MADFYPLMARTVAGLADNTPETRGQVYARARSTLNRHLEAADPPLAESELMRQRLALDEAIARLEREYAPAPPLPDEASEPLRPRVATRAEADAARGSGWRRWTIAAVVLMASAAIGGYAFTHRDDPKRYQPALADTPAPVDPEPPADRPKTSARIGAPAPPAVPDQPSAPGAAPAPPVATPAPASSPPVPPSDPPPTAAGDPQAVPAIAQRATLIRANEDRTKPPDVIAGRVTWRRVDASPGEGKPMEPTISIGFDFEAAELSGSILIRRNTDAALPATHTIEVIFSPKAGTDPITEIQLPQLKDEETVRGAPLLGVPFPVGENLFVVALSNLPSDAPRNATFLAEKGWYDLPFAYRSARRAMITFERGLSGEKVVKEVMAAWEAMPKP